MGMPTFGRKLQSASLCPVLIRSRDMMELLVDVVVVDVFLE